MKTNINNILFNYFHNKTVKANNKKEIAQIQQIILTDIGAISKNHQYTEQKDKAKSIHPLFRNLWLSVCAFSIVVIVFFGIHTLFSKPATAQEVVQEAKKRMSTITRIYFTQTQSGKSYYYPLPQTQGDIEFFGVSVHKAVNRIWFDIPTGNRRYEQETKEQLFDTGHENSKPMKLEAMTIASVERSIDRTQQQTTTFVADEKTKEGVFRNNGTFKKYVRPEQEEYLGFYPTENPQKEFTKLLDYLGSEKTQLTTIKESGKTYHKLELTIPVNEGLKENKNPFLRKYILTVDAETYLPHKEQKFYKDDKAYEEYLYSDFSTEFGNEVFELIPPKGYSLMKNVQFEMEKDPEITLVKCGSELFNMIYKENMEKDCPSNTYGIYDVSAKTVKNGKSTVIVGPGNPGILQSDFPSLEFKLFKSNERFTDKISCLNYANPTFSEVLKTEIGYSEKENPTIQPYAQFKLEVWDKENMKKVQEIILVGDTRGIELLPR